jgi:glycosyltransferase involved in cell wall biosynthesis
MRVQFFNTYEPVTTFYRDLLPYLREKGLASEVLISAAEYRQGGRGKLSEVFSGPAIQVRYLPALGLQPEGKMRKLIIMSLYIMGSMMKTLLGSAADVNFFLTQPPLFNVWGWVLKKIRRQPYICLVMDIYPDVAVMAGLIPKYGFVNRLLTRLSRFALEQADAVVVIGRLMAKRVKDRGVDEDKIHLIPNWANPDIVYPIAPSDNQLRRELGLSDKFVVQYSGNMGVSHDFDDLLEVIRRCQDETALRFVFIGGGVRRKEVETFSAKHNLRNVTLLPFQPLERLAESLSLGDVHFVSLREGFGGLVVPSKVYGTLAAGRPVIFQGNVKTEVARMIMEEDLGVVISPGNTSQLERAIRTYVHAPGLASQQGGNAYRLTQGKYAMKTDLEKYYQIVSKIADA